MVYLGEEASSFMVFFFGVVDLQLRAGLFFILFFCVSFLGCFVYCMFTKLVSLVIYAVLFYQKKKIFMVCAS